MDDVSRLLPPELSPLAAVTLCVASFFTSGLTAAFGVGGGVSLLALMGLFLPVTVLIPLHGVVQLGSNAGRAWVQRVHIPWRRLWFFILGAAVGSLLGAQFVVRLDDAVLKVVLGAFILVLVWVRVPALGNARPGVLAGGGLVTSFLGMFVGASGPLVIALFEKAFADRRAVVASHAAAMSVQHALKVGAFVIAGFAFREWLPLMLAMVTAGFLGTLLGTRLLEAMPESGFRRGFRIVMSVLAATLIARGVYG